MFKEILELIACWGDVVDHEFGCHVKLAGYGLEILPRAHLWSDLVIPQRRKPPICSIATASVGAQPTMQNFVNKIYQASVNVQLLNGACWRSNVC